MGTTFSYNYESRPSNSPCFFCGKNVAHGVVWHGQDLVSNELLLHEGCVVELTMHLMKDRYELLFQLKEGSTTHLCLTRGRD